MKKIIALTIFMLIGTVGATLGNYVEGGTVIYPAVCHTDEGNRDTGCVYNNVSILNSSDVPHAETTQLSEVSDTTNPGLWRGKFTVPSGAEVGVWIIDISLNNSNGTAGGTAWTFQVLDSDSGFGNISDKIDNLETEAIAALRFENQTKNITAVIVAIEAKIDEANYSIQHYVSGNISDLQDYLEGNISELPNWMWNSSHAPSRVLTYYPPTIGIFDVDFRSGLLNRSYYYVSPARVLGGQAPANDESMATNYQHRVIFDIDGVPTNVTNGWIYWWAKKTGSPTGNLQVWVEGTVVNTTDVSTLTTSYQFFNTSFGGGNITDHYIEITFNGSSAWSVPNNVQMGAGERTAVYSDGSSDGGLTWTHLTYELVVMLVIENNQPSFADEINEEVNDIVGREIQVACPGENIVAHWKVRDFKGATRILDSASVNCSVQYIENGTGVFTGVSGATFITLLHDNIDILAIWNNTGGRPTNVIHHFECNVSWVSGADSGDFKSHKNFIFSRLCDIEANQTLIIDDIAIVQADLNDPDQFKSNATVENQEEILAGMITNHSASLAKMDDLNSSFQSFVSGYINGLNTTMLLNFSGIAADLITIAGYVDQVEGYVDDVNSGGIKTVYDLLGGLNNVSAADVYTYFTSGSNEDEFKSNATVEKQDEILVEISAINVTVEDFWAETLGSNKSADDTVTYIYDDIIYGGGS